jgi:hypothetical protein
LAQDDVAFAGFDGKAFAKMANNKTVPQFGSLGVSQDTADLRFGA